MKRMIRRGVIKQSTTFTYHLETDEEDNKMRGIQTVDQVHVRSEDGLDWMIRWIFKQMAKFT